MITPIPDNIPKRHAPKKVNMRESLPNRPLTKTKVKFEVYGEEMVEKSVKLSSNSGRVYLPPDWVGSRVKIIRIE